MWFTTQNGENMKFLEWLRGWLIVEEEPEEVLDISKEFPKETWADLHEGSGYYDKETDGDSSDE